MSKMDEQQEPAGEVSLLESAAVDFFRTAWNSKALIILLPLIFAFLGGIQTINEKYNSYTPTYLYAVQLTFEGSVRQQYPNGNPFSISDLTDTRVLQRVADKYDLDKYGYSVAGLRKSLNVTSRNTEHFAIMREFEILTQDWAKSVAQLEQIKEDMRTRLAQASDGQLQIRLFDQNSSLPPQVANAVVSDIVSTWAEIAIDERGVVSYQIAQIPSASLGLNPLIDETSIEALSALQQQLSAVSNFVTELAAQAGVQTALDPETGKSIVSIQRDINSITEALRKLPSNWSLDIDRYFGKTALPIDMHTRNIFDAEILKDQDYLVALDLVETRIALLREDIAKLVLQPMGARATDPVTGHTAYEIDQVLQDIVGVDLNRLRGPLIEYGITRDEEGVKLYYQTQIKELKRKNIELKQRIEVVRQALQEGKQVYSGSVANQALDGELPNAGSAGQVTLPQVGDGFIDRLLELSQQSSGNEFMRQLIEQGSSIRMQQVENKARISRLEYYTDQVGNDGNNKGAAQLSQERKLAAYVDEKLPDIMRRLREHADALNRIATRLAYAAEIHKTVYPQHENLEQFSEFLSDAKDNSITIDKVIEQLRNTNDAAIRILGLLNVNSLNADGRLYRPASAVERLPVDLIDIKSFLWLALCGAIGGLVAMLLVGFISIRKTLGRFAQ